MGSNEMTRSGFASFSPSKNSKSMPEAAREYRLKFTPSERMVAPSGWLHPFLIPTGASDGFSAKRIFPAALMSDLPGDEDHAVRFASGLSGTFALTCLLQDSTSGS